MPKDREPKKIPASDMSVEDIFFRLRRSMGQTWEAGTFNQGEAPVPTIEGEGKVLGDTQIPKSPITEKRLGGRNG